MPPRRPPFAERALEAMAEFGPLTFGLDPSAETLVAWGLGDTPDGLERFVDIVMTVAAGTVGVVKPQAAFYERHGWRGMRALTRLVAGCRQGGVLVLLDAKRGDVGSTNVAYAEAYLGDAAPLAVDAITITPYLGLAALSPIVDRAADAGAGVFVVTRSSNPEGRALQQARHSDGRSVEQRLVADIGAENRRRAPGRIGPLGAVFGPTHRAPDDLDLLAMQGLFLAPGVGAQGASPDDVATCFATCPGRVLASASRSVLAHGPQPAALRDGLRSLGDELRRALGAVRA